MRIDVVTPATDEPVTLDEAKAHLRVFHASDGLLIGAQITAAREHVESRIGYPIVTTAMRATLDCWPAVITLPACPISAVTAVKYIDVDGAEQTLPDTEYSVDLSGGGARIRPAYGKSWPSLRPEAAAVRVEYTAGVALANAPRSLTAAILLLVGDMYENAEGQIVGVSVAPNATVDNLIWPHRLIVL